MQKKELFKNIPSVHEILNFCESKNITKKYKKEILKKIIIQTLDELRENISSSNNSYFENFENKEDIFSYIIYMLNQKINKLENKSYEKIINATGIAIHTNFGRSPINKQISEKTVDIASTYMSIEYDIKNSSRFDRNEPIKNIMQLLTGCEDAIVVNNNAAALLLVFDTFCKNKNALISRGELIEIGDNFRILDIISSTEANIKEIGSTNRTYTNDYEKNIDENTSLILKVNKSNYKITGFTNEVSTKELSNICKRKDLILFEDLGSGNLTDFSKYGFNYEKNVQDVLDEGADIVCFSTDKLIGACQGSIIIGKSKYIQKLRKNPIFRALRAGKTVITTIFETLKLYMYKDFNEQIPILNMIFTKQEKLYEKAQKLYNLLNKDLFEYIEIEKSISKIGGGVSSNTDINSYSLVLKCTNISTNNFENILRMCKEHIIGYIRDDKLILDMLCIFDDEIEIIAQKINSLKPMIEILDKKDGPTSIFIAD